MNTEPIPNKNRPNLTTNTTKNRPTPITQPIIKLTNLKLNIKN